MTDIIHMHLKPQDQGFKFPSLLSLSFAQSCSPCKTASFYATWSRPALRRIKSSKGLGASCPWS